MSETKADRQPDHSRELTTTAGPECRTTPAEFLNEIRSLGRKASRCQTGFVQQFFALGQVCRSAQVLCREQRMPFEALFIRAYGLSRATVFASIRFHRRCEEHAGLQQSVASVRAATLLAAQGTPDCVRAEALQLFSERQQPLHEDEVKALVAKHRPASEATPRTAAEQMVIGGTTIVIRPGKHSSPQVVESLRDAIRRIAAKAQQRAETSARRTE